MSSSLQSFDGDTLEAALARVTEECGAGARVTQAEKIRTGGIGGFFARERYEVTVEVEESRVRRSEIAEPAPAPTPAEPMSLLDLVDQVSDQERAATTTSSLVATPSTEGQTFREVLRDIVSQSGLAEAIGPDVTAVPTAEPDGMFRSLGIPATVVDGPAAASSTAQQLLAVLEGIDAAPPVLARRGDVVAVVGPSRQAIAAAAVLADQLGQTAEDVVVAAPGQRGMHTLSDATMAEERAALWRRCGVPFVVAVCAAEGDAGTGWARTLLAALEPVTIWGAVSAERKPEDIAAWADAVGGVDALAVTGCERTASPAAVLGAGIPVAVLEGRRASPAAWTALLVERLTL